MLQLWPLIFGDSFGGETSRALNFVRLNWVQFVASVEVNNGVWSKTLAQIKWKRVKSLVPTILSNVTSICTMWLGQRGPDRIWFPKQKQDLSITWTDRIFGAEVRNNLERSEQVGLVENQNETKGKSKELNGALCFYSKVGRSSPVLEANKGRIYRPNSIFLGGKRPLLFLSRCFSGNRTLPRFRWVMGSTPNVLIGSDAASPFNQALNIQKIEHVGIIRSTMK